VFLKRSKPGLGCVSLKARGAALRAFSSQAETPGDSENAIIQEVRAPVLIQSKPEALFAPTGTFERGILDIMAIYSGQLYLDDSYLSDYT
jgi:hypothetical protein